MNIQDFISKKTEEMVLQDYLSLGYILLLFLGIIYETVYYSFLGINILAYSSILDVLLSPIALLTGNLLLAVAVFGIIGLALLYMKYLPEYYAKLAKKEKYQLGKHKEKLAKKIKKIESENYVKMYIVFLISVFLGLSIGAGFGVKYDIEKDEIKLTHELVFYDGEVQKIKRLGKNGSYIFYITKDKRDIAIAPISGNIKTITILKNK